MSRDIKMDTTATVVPDLGSPHNIEAERSVLGALIMRNELIPQVVGTLRPEHFFRSAHAEIYRAALQLHEAGTAVDGITLVHHLGRAGRLDDVGGYAYVSALGDGVPRSVNLAHYADIVLDLARRRTLIDYASQVVKDAVRSSGEADAVLARAAISLDRLSGVARRSRAELLDEVALVNRPSPTTLSEGRLPCEGLAGLSGASGLGKTFGVIDLALSVTTGRDWLGARTVTSGPVVYVAAEGAAGISVRVRGWKTTYGYPLEESTGLLVWDSPVNLMDSLAVTEFIASIKPRYPILVIFDTLARCMVGGDENSAQDMGLAIENADRVRVALHATVLIVHHTGKSGESERGSSAFRGALDTHIKLKEADDILTLVCDKQKDFAPFSDVRLRLVPSSTGETCVMRLASETAPQRNLTPAQSRCLRALIDSFGDHGATKAEWKATVPDVKDYNFYRASTRLEDLGYIASASGARGRWTVTPSGRVLAPPSTPSSTSPLRGVAG